MPRQLYGIVNPKAELQQGSSGGVTVSRDEEGIYTAVFLQPFTNTPAVTTTQIFPNNTNDKGGDTKDNAVLIGITNSLFKVKTGDKDGRARDRWFSFSVIGD
jgi:hypothetical protein